MLMNGSRIVDDKGMELTDPDCRGEIVVKSPSIMQGYLGNMAATQESIDKSGWLKTGDVACIKQGKIYIVDRKKVRSRQQILIPVKQRLT